MITINLNEIAGWGSAILGMRNPMNSWDKSDSCFVDLRNFIRDGIGFKIGPNDLKLARKLALAGTDHSKYRRMIVVWADIKAPLYFWPQLDAYKVGTVRNSCSFMHRGTAKPYTVNDFSFNDERIYEILSPLPQKEYELHFPYETDEYKTYTAENGRTYRVYKNGKVIREAFEYTDTYGTGRTRAFEDAPATMWKNAQGYTVVKLSGRAQNCVLLHRLVASLWCPRPEGATQVNHINGDKGDNSAENLEWVTPKENMQKASETGLTSNVSSLHAAYAKWKQFSKSIPLNKRSSFYIDATVNSMTSAELSNVYGITPERANCMRYEMKHSEHEDLFQYAYTWECLLKQLNSMREEYNETKDPRLFTAIRELMPQGYLQTSTLMLSYEVLANIYKSRRNHKLDEWREFCKWIEGLPYAADIIFPWKDEKEKDT